MNDSPDFDHTFFLSLFFVYFYFFSSGSRSPRGKHRLQRKWTPDGPYNFSINIYLTNFQIQPTTLYRVDKNHLEPHITLCFCLKMTRSTRHMLYRILWFSLAMVLVWCIGKLSSHFQPICIEGRRFKHWGIFSATCSKI